jgi:phytoene synthase
MNSSSSPTPPPYTATGIPASEHCAREVRRLDRDRYLCALFAPADRRAALFALCAFNLEVARVRESVSEPLLGEIRLQWWRDTVAEVYTSSPRQHPVALALAEAVAAHDLSRDLFDRLIDARAFDLSDEPPQDLAALEAYADATAATLVQLGCEVLGSRSAATQAAARHVGIAWALTGLVRAVPFHAAHRRLYLPQDLLDRAGVDTEDVFRHRASPGLAAVVEQVLATAERHLVEARAQRAEVPRAILAALLPAAIADLHIARLRRSGCDPFAAGLEVSGPRRLLRLWWAATRGRY